MMQVTTKNNNIISLEIKGSFDSYEVRNQIVYGKFNSFKKALQFLKNEKLYSRINGIFMIGDTSMEDNRDFAHYIIPIMIKGMEIPSNFPQSFQSFNYLIKTQKLNLFKKYPQSFYDFIDCKNLDSKIIIEFELYPLKSIFDDINNYRNQLSKNEINYYRKNTPFAMQRQFHEIYGYSCKMFTNNNCITEIKITGDKLIN